MVTYNVTIAADGYSTFTLGSMLNELSLSSGSADGIEQSQPSNLRISFLNTPSDAGTSYPASWWLGKAITVTITPSDTTDYIYWKGFVATASVQAEDSTGDTVTIGLSAYSRMQILQQQDIDLTTSGGGLTQSARVAAVMADAVALKWSEWDGTTTWGNISTAYTWATIDSIRPSFQVDYIAGLYASPMSSTVPFYAAGPTDALSYFQLFATSCNAWLYEYAKNGTHQGYWQRWRIDTPLLETAIDLTSVLLSQSLRTDLDVSRLANEITFVPNYDPTFGVLTAGDISSIEQYGYRPQSYDIENYAYAEMINNVLYRYSQPWSNLTTMDILIDALPAANKIDFMFSGANNRYAFTGIPQTFGGDETYEIRGSQLTLQYETAVATVTVVPNKFWVNYTPWWNAGTLAWSAYATASTKWQDII